MRFKRHHHKRNEAELEITSFLNLMIILVPVLLVMMVFSRITVVDLSLPDLGDSSQDNPEVVQRVEVVFNLESLYVNFTQDDFVKRIGIINKKEGEHDFKLLSLTLQEFKRNLREAGIDKREILILSRPETDYQELISAIDAVRSYKAVVVTDVVDAELFPLVSLGDAPIDGSSANGGSR